MGEVRVIRHERVKQHVIQCFFDMGGATDEELLQELEEMDDSEDKILANLELLYGG